MWRLHDPLQLTATSAAQALQRQLQLIRSAMDGELPPNVDLSTVTQEAISAASSLSQAASDQQAPHAEKQEAPAPAGAEAAQSPTPFQPLPAADSAPPLPTAPSEDASAPPSTPAAAAKEGGQEHADGPPSDLPT